MNPMHALAEVIYGTTNPFFASFLSYLNASCKLFCCCSWPSFNVSKCGDTKYGILDGSLHLYQGSGCLI